LLISGPISFLNLYIFMGGYFCTGESIEMCS
jgi:hypothetical protein